MRTHFKPTKIFQCTHLNSCHPAGVKKGFVQGEALRLLRTKTLPKKLNLKGGSSLAKIEFEEKVSTLCHAISTVISKLEKHTYGQMASNTEQAMTKRDIQGASLVLS